MNIASGNSETVLPGISIADYDISRDEKEVAYSTTALNGPSKVWLASLDRRTPPREIAAGDQVSFGADGELVFRSLEGTTTFPVRIKKDGSGREPVTTVPILEKSGVSPDGNWVIAFSLDYRERARWRNSRDTSSRWRPEKTLRWLQLPGSLVTRWKILVRGHDRGHFRPICGEIGRHPHSGGQIAAGFARCRA